VCPFFIGEIMALVWKAIKPQRLKDKGFRLTLINKARKIGNAMKRDFEATTKTWNHKPVFTVDVSTKGQGPAVLVGTNSEIYGYVNDGTKPHDIYPKRAKVLRFQGGYSAKTSPGVIGSGAGGSSGATVFSRGVRHPGTKARNFDEVIARKWQTRFRAEMEEAMAQATKESGHSI
jgi:hypothetical protein